MGQKKTESCHVCWKTIGKMEHKKCPFCNSKAHSKCIESSDLAFEGYFYCQDHQRMRPAQTCRTARPVRQEVLNSEVRKMLETALTASESIKTQSSQDKTPLTTDQIELLSQSIQIINEIIGSQSQVNCPKSNTKACQPQNKSRNDNSNLQQFDRVPNYASAVLLPPPFTPNCEKCHLPISDMFFKCFNCKLAYHDHCIQGNARMYQILGSWACISCKTIHDGHEALMNYCGSRDSIIQEKQDKQVEMFANMRLDDPFFNQPRITQYPFKNNILEAHRRKQTERQETPKTSGPVTNTNRIHQSLDNEISELQRQRNIIDEKLKATINKSVSQKDPVAQSTPSGIHMRNYESATQQTPPIQANEPKDPQVFKGKPNPPDHSSYSNISHEIEQLVEASIARRINRQPEVQIDYNRQLVELQLIEANKNTYRVLPKVTKLGYEWKIFYESFQNSKNLFTPIENVIRIQKAILCDEIIKLGGINLFTAATYEETLMELDKRIGKPEKMLINEKKKLLGALKLKNNDTKGIIDLIEEIKGYSVLVNKIGSFGDKSDPGLISRLSRILPDKLMHGWAKEYCRLKEETNEVLINDLARWLSQQTKTLETNILFNELDPYGDIKYKNYRPANTTNQSSKKEPKDHKFYIHNEELTGEDESLIESMNTINTYEKRDSAANYCWFHKKKGHSSLYCYSLLAKPGKEVTELAKSNAICTICSAKAHPNCPQKEKFVCLLPECNFKHAMIFCQKRKCQKSTIIPKKKENQSEENVSCHLSNQIEICDNDTHEQQDMASQMTFDALQLHNEEDSDEENPCWTMRDSSNKANKAAAIPKKPKTSPSLVSAITVTLENEGKAVKCALLLDSGSTCSLIDEKYAAILNLKGPKKPISLTWSGGRSRKDDDSKIVKAKATGHQEGAKTFDIYFRTIKDLGMPAQHFNAEEIKQKFPHLANLPLNSYYNIIGVIGTDQSMFFQQIKWIDLKDVSKKEAPIVILTPLGYSMIGNSIPLHKLYDNLTNVTKEKNSCLIQFNESDEEELQKMEERAVGLEYKKPFENDRKIAEDDQALTILKNNVQFIQEEKRYVAPLLWREEDIKLPTSESLRVATRRARILENHAKRIGKLDDIHAQITNLLDKGYARKLKDSEAVNYTNKSFYIPIFISCPKGKRTRLIWDAAAKIEGKSLNEYLYAGPNLYNNLFHIIVQLREGRYFVKADVMEMFHQIKINPEDCEALRFIFPQNNKMEHYIMTRMVFGIICSPTTSQYVKNNIAERNETKYQEAAHAIKNSMYVDDLVKSFDDTQVGGRLIHEAREILKSGGLELVKIRANDPQVLETIKKNLTLEENNNPKLFSIEEKEKLLGYSINFSTDSISLVQNYEKLKPDILDGNKVPTKKEILKFLMAFFDPLGLFTYFTSKIKLLYHWTCKEKLEWNDVITSKQTLYWNKIIKWVPEIMKIEIPRNYSSYIQQAHKRQLIIMGDAGKECLCTVAYLRLTDNNNHQIDYSLVASKSYIVPLRQKRTIPELELDIASKSVQFFNDLKMALTIKIDEVIFVTDSTCVYSWTQKGANKATIYIRNRLNRIKSLSTKDQWIWIPTELQAADYGTKFEAMPQNTKDNNWFHPKIFSLPEENWLRLQPPVNDMQEKFNLTIQTEENEKEKFYNKFSSWNKLLSITNIIFKWKEITFNKTLSEKSSENEAEMALIRIAQREILHDEIDHIENGNVLKKSNKLFKFNPFVDEKGILRITTRLSALNNCDRDKISPIVLPKQHNITKLIILKQHNNNHHSHHKTIMANIMQRFYIPNISWTIKKIIRENCFKCKRNYAKPDRPQMGDLPGYRLAAYTPPFSYVIMDVCGPFSIMMNRRTQKRWLLVSSCLTTRGVHIEILYSMDTNSCLMAFQNMVNIRGAPKRVVSDQGSNFIGAKNVMNDMQTKWNKILSEKGIIKNNIQWDFNPAKAASMNGSVERIIGLIKNVMKNMSETLNKRLIIPSDEVFRCMICEIIGMLNNRPLTMTTIQDTENCFLTPNYFLQLRPNFQSGPSSNEYNKCTLKDWQQVKEMINVLWEHFHRVYLTEIMHREKWVNYKKPLAVGDIVVLADPTVNNLWRLGKVVQVEPGSQNQVRKVTICLGKRKIVDKKSVKNRNTLMNAYKNECFIEVTRPACEVAPINLSTFSNISNDFLP